MGSDWAFTPGRVGLLFAMGAVLGASVVLGVVGSSAHFVTAAAAALSGVALALSCRSRGEGSSGASAEKP